MKRIFLVFIYLQCLNNLTKAQNPPPVKQLNPSFEIEDPTFNNKVPGRPEIIEAMKDIDSDFVFKQSKDADNQIKYTAIDKYNTSVEITGDENDVRILKWTMVFVPNKEADNIELDRIGRFAILVEHAKGIQWLSEQIKAHISPHPLDDYNVSEELTKGRKIKFDYTPRLKCMSLTITVEK